MSVERQKSLSGRMDSLFVRLDALGDEINRALARTTRIQESREPRNGDRIVALQRRIDDGRINGRLPQTEGREFQARLDSIRSDYMRMTEGGRYSTHDERTDISRRLDSLESALDRSGRRFRNIAFRFTRSVRMLFNREEYLETQQRSHLGS